MLFYSPGSMASGSSAHSENYWQLISWHDVLSNVDADESTKERYV